MRGRLYLRNIIHHFFIEVTLTYPLKFPWDGSVVNRHLNTLRASLRRRGVSMFWVEEFQKRGAPHFHLLVNKFINKKWLADTWYRIVDSGDPKHLVAGTRVDFIRDRNKTASYMQKYLTKKEQKVVPDGFVHVGRFWGFTRGLLKVRIDHLKSDYKTLARLLRHDRNRYTRKCRDWGFKWKWKGRGFTFWDSGPPNNDIAPNLKLVIDNCAF